MAKKIFGAYLAKLDAPNSEAHARLELPASPWELHDAMDKVQLQENEELYLEIDDYYGFEYLAPHLMELDAFNDFAESVKAMPSREKQLPKLKALLEHFEVTNLAAAASLAEHIGDYILTPEISSPQEAAIDELNFTMDAHSVELLLPHVNLFALSLIHIYITLADLASPELVTDEAFRLITGALLMAKYGDVVLNLEKGVDETCGLPSTA